MGLETDEVKAGHEAQRVELTIFEDDQVKLLSDGIDFLPPF